MSKKLNKNLKQMGKILAIFMTVNIFIHEDLLQNYFKNINLLVEI